MPISFPCRQHSVLARTPAYSLSSLPLPNRARCLTMHRSCLASPCVSLLLNGGVPPLECFCSVYAECCLFPHCLGCRASQCCNKCGRARVYGSLSQLHSTAQRNTNQERRPSCSLGLRLGPQLLDGACLGAQQQLRWRLYGGAEAPWHGAAHTAGTPHMRRRLAVTQLPSCLPSPEKPGPVMASFVRPRKVTVEMPSTASRAGSRRPLGT